MTWKSASDEGQLLDRRSAVQKQGATYAWDVTSFIRDELGGDKIVSLIIMDPMRSTYPVKFENRESANSPVLTVITNGATDVDNTEHLAQSVDLAQNYPNPFNPLTMISYNLRQLSEVYLSVYNMQGQLINMLVSEKQAAGSYIIQWDSKNNQGVKMPSGIYFYRLEVQSQNQKLMKMQKMILMK